MTFEKLELISPILKALQERNYKEPTAIQEQAIPKILAKRDILGSAQTGTGKTAAFALPIIQLLHTEKNNDKGRLAIKSLIVTPTRELAIQIDENLEFYGKYTKLKHAVIFGGVKQGAQVNEIRRGVDILVATPGRLLDLINQGFIKLDHIKIFVLDEADRMLDMGFINDIKKLLKLLPKKRQSLFFSATMPDNIVSLADNILTDPVKIEVNPVSSAADTVKQKVYYTNKDAKKDLLFHILENKDIDQVLLFSRTKHGADKITRNLKSKNINAAAIHGNKAQNHRQKVLSQFKEGTIRVLVATDIAARGIDIDKLQYVINYDVPEDPETYVHRIGRSGRAGESGTAISLCEPEENGYVRLIERLINQKITEVDNNPFPQTEKPMSALERKEFNKEKQRKKQAFFKNRKKSR
ncbi:DEAD/DEAH box helicase [Cyclobacterium amurskyense]|uniref:DEAD-box ATP-dependent RNA helicase RhpA n=1 Tax=Cyclobacterium amurskyense TaxID=320787 RepID=A0A0H4P8Q6_9BACT|nr:DEAD/DEAH box helicase [Cyclobacterium amurskyense]AKP50871.1 ATP-dependent RNA helicase RhlE [Cyclobacterium amurskyense]